MIKKKLPFIQHDNLVKGISASPKNYDTELPHIDYFPSIPKVTKLNALRQH